jgi:indole-3-glycerol phosphate synthase
MVDILEKIVATKRAEVADAKQLVSVAELEKQIDLGGHPQLSLAGSLMAELGIIAEFKRASPSKGVINSKVTVNEVVKGYDTDGAVGISVLTDKSYFKAIDDDFKTARSYSSKPLLRKEFIIDAYQLYETKAIGANVVLLIAAILTKEEIRSFTQLAHSLELEVLIELHDSTEIEKLCGNEDLIGVNNRNLNTFKVDIKQSVYIKSKLGSISDTPFVSESGLSSISEISLLRNEGFRGFLIGEYFMKQHDPVLAFTTLNKQLSALKQ